MLGEDGHPVSYLQDANPLKFMPLASSRIVRAHSSGNVSVVMKARAAAFHDTNPRPSVLPASGPCGRSAVRILEIGKVWPITPVDMTSISEGDDDGGLGEGGGARRASVARAMTHASARPLAAGDGVRTAAIDDEPEGARPRVCLRTSLQAVTGAAWNALRVKDAAADVGRDEVERMTARSRSEGSFFTPLCTPPRR